jgi:hypothetical protein
MQMLNSALVDPQQNLKDTSSHRFRVARVREQGFSVSTKRDDATRVSAP